MSNIKCITSTAPIGCTFVEWSVHFLSGGCEYYNVPNHRWIPIPDNPITGVNAHGHDKNHPWGYQETVDHIAEFRSISNSKLFTFYPHGCYADQAIAELGITAEQLAKKEYLQKVFDYQQQDYNRALEACHAAGIPVVYIGLTHNNILYNKFQRTPHRTFFKHRPEDLEEGVVNTEFDELFYPESADQWANDKLTNIWDHRERLALCVRPFDPVPFEGQIKFPHLWINAQRVWAFAEPTVKEIMDYYNLKLQPDKLDQWRSVYRQWQRIQEVPYNFSCTYQHIVDSIVNNWYYEIPNLTFDQEVVIQHCLIYQHNLNLKTWNLSKFPNNTQDLHKLLETNIHQVPKLY